MHSFAPRRGFVLIFAAVAALHSVLVAPAASVEPEYLIGIAVGRDGAVYLADRKLPGVFTFEEGEFSPLFTGSKKFGTPLNAIRCLAIDRDGKLLAGDSATRDVYRFDDAGQPVPLTKGRIGIPMSIAVTKGGDLIVADLELQRLWKVPAAGGKPELFAEIPAPRGVFVDGDDRVWVVSHGKDQLLRLDGTGQEVQVVVSGRPFDFPSSVVVDEAGSAFVCDTYAKCVWQVSPAAKPAKLPGLPALKSAVALAIRDSELWIIDPRLPEPVRHKLP